MKILRFVLILSFMLTFAVHPAQAKAGERYGFVPLVTKADPNMPLEVQAQQAFELILPQLNAAQKNGEILEFEPEFMASILKIKYAASTGMTASTFTSTQEFDDIQAAVAQVPQTQNVADTNSSGVSSEALIPHFNLYLYSSCFRGYGVTSGSKVLGSLYNKAGKIVANFGGDSDVNDNMNGCFSWYSGESDIQPGYKATYRIYSAADGTLLRTLTIVVPSITLDDTGRADSVVTGTGPANKAYLLSWWHANLNSNNTYTFSSNNGIISNQRSFQADFGNVPLRGGDWLQLTVTQNANFGFYLNTNVHFTSCYVDTNYCIVVTFPQQMASMTITHSGQSYTFTKRTDSDGYAYFPMYDAQNHPLILAGGDKVQTTGILSYKLANLTAKVDFTSNKIQGAAPANSYFDLRVIDPYTHSAGSRWAHAKPTATYSVDFTSSFDFNQENGLQTKISYTDPETGNKTDRSFIFGQ